MNRFSSSELLLRGLQIVFFTGCILYFGRDLLIPMLYGLLVALVLYPLCKKLEQYKWPRSVAIAFCLVCVSILISGLIFLVVYQLNVLKNELPVLVSKATPALSQVRKWLQVTIGIDPAEQMQWWGEAGKNFRSHFTDRMQSLIVAISGTLITALLVPVYAALFLYQRRTFVLFVTKLAGESMRAVMPQILRDVVSTYAGFIKGTAMVYLVVGCLNALGLALLGIPHAILFGMITALMTIVPYVGILLGAMLPIAAAWITKDSMWYPIGVIAIFSLVQYLEANVIFPRLVGASLKVSTWAMLVAIIAGGILWGVAGMILFIPFVGILKIVLSYVPEGRGLNLLLQRNTPV